MYSWCLSLSFAVSYRYYERFLIINYKFLYSSCYSLHCFIGKRSYSSDAILFLYLCRCIKNAWARNTKVKFCICSNIRFYKSSLNLFTVQRSMCMFWPFNWLSITSCYHKESFPFCRCSIVSSYKFIKFNIIS